MADGAGSKSTEAPIQTPASIWVGVGRRTHDQTPTHMADRPVSVDSEPGRPAPRRFSDHSTPWVKSRHSATTGLRTPEAAEAEAGAVLASPKKSGAVPAFPLGSGRMPRPGAG